MAHTIKCAHDLCRCMIANTPGTDKYCIATCKAQDEDLAEAQCNCGHEECRGAELREVGSGPRPSAG